jgi:hypothetical protein
VGVPAQAVRSRAVQAVQTALLPGSFILCFLFWLSPPSPFSIVAAIPIPYSPQVPDFATHVIGMGGLCVNSQGEVLVVKEIRASTATSQVKRRDREPSICDLRIDLDCSSEGRRVEPYSSCDTGEAAPQASP